MLWKNQGTQSAKEKMWGKKKICMRFKYISSNFIQSLIILRGSIGTQNSHYPNTFATLLKFHGLAMVFPRLDMIEVSRQSPNIYQSFSSQWHILGCILSLVLKLAKTISATELAWTFTLFTFHLSSFSNYLLFQCPNIYHMHMKNDKIIIARMI